MKMRFLVTLLALLTLTEAGINYNAKDRRLTIKLRGKGKWKPLHPRKIIGGEEVAPHSIPYQVALIVGSNEGGWFCGGSLISKSVVLTAAHCVEGATEATVVLGAHKYKESEESQTHATAKRFIAHPEFSATDYAIVNDIGLIELTEAVTLNEFIQLVDLPTVSDVNNSFANEKGRVSGWGLYADNATDTSDVLRSVNVNVMSNSDCNVQWEGAVADSQVCSAGEGPVGACSGDSGGPLVIGNKQIGLVSYGTGLGCELGWPSVYTRLTSYLDFINGALRRL